jgi:preprotein translocase subunit SecY
MPPMEPTERTDLSRRGFLSALFMAGSLLVSYGVALAYGVRFLFRRAEKPRFVKVLVTYRTNLPEGDTYIFQDLSGRKLMLVNQAGIIPVIFASSMLYLPVLLSNVLPTGGFWDDVRGFIDDHLVSGTGFWYMSVFGIMIIFFAYFYTAISFDPVKQADTIRRQGGYIPGIRPGPQTERYLGRILNRITLPGALFVAMIALLPSILLATADITNFPFGGISVLIAVGVMLEFMKQIDSQLMMRNYEGFLN